MCVLVQQMLCTLHVPLLAVPTPNPVGHYWQHAAAAHEVCVLPFDLCVYPSWM